MSKGMYDDIIIEPKEHIQHKMCQAGISSVCTVCPVLGIRKEGDKKHSHCEDGFFGESHQFNRMNGAS